MEPTVEALVDYQTAFAIVAYYKAYRQTFTQPSLMRA